MKQMTISFRADAQKIAALDELAKALDRDRSHVLSEAITAYLDLYQWQKTHITEGLRQADAEEWASPQAIARALKPTRT